MSKYTVDGKIVENKGESGLTWVDNKFFTIDFLGKKYHGEIVKSSIEDGVFTVKVNQRTFAIRRNHPLDDLIKSMGLDKQKIKKLHQLQSPMPGRILSYAVAAGSEVFPGTPLLTLEAMKMENVIKAEGEGIVKKVLYASESVVEKGAVLIEFE
jgi:biotin carboxyl carrier protein